MESLIIPEVKILFYDCESHNKVRPAKAGEVILEIDSEGRVSVIPITKSEIIMIVKSGKKCAISYSDLVHRMMYLFFNKISQLIEKGKI